MKLPVPQILGPTATSGATIWLTGLSGAGKSTIAGELRKELHRNDLRCFVLDGDSLRLGLNSDLGFSDRDREENVRRVGEVAKLFALSGVVAVVSMISPFARHRAQSRSIHAVDGIPFIEVFVATPLTLCEERDPKGLYKMARAGKLRGFTGIDAPYEVPDSPELTLNTTEMSARACAWACYERLLDVRGLRAAQ